jgi:lipid-A-disaccharide synthase
VRRVFISAGEASGEQYAVQLMAALRPRLGEVEFFGLGGIRMEAAGFHRVVRAEDVAVLGITEIVRHIPRIYREYRKLRRALSPRDATERPDVLVLIDFPDVNLGLARRARALGIPVVFFVSPQVWAWKKHRLSRIRRDVDRMLVIFPFEEPWYRERGVPATFVGHPLAELPLPSITRQQFAAEHALNPAKHWIGLLPGSRPREIALNLPAMLGAAKLLGPEHEYVLPLAPTLSPAQESDVRRMLAVAAPMRVTLTHDARSTLHHARASVVASGTATVEAALIGNPFAVVYRLSGASYALAKRVVKVPHVAMANLVAGERIVPELIQDAFTPEAVAASMRTLIEPTPERAAMQLALARVRLSLQGDASAIDTVADHVLSLLPGFSSSTPMNERPLSLAL